MEVHVQPGEAAILWGAGEAEQAAPGALPRLQVQAPTQTDLHCGGPKAEGGRVQSHDEEPQAGAEGHLHTQVENQPTRFTLALRESPWGEQQCPSLLMVTHGNPPQTVRPSAFPAVFGLLKCLEPVLHDECNSYSSSDEANSCWSFMLFMLFFPHSKQQAESFIKQILQI